MRYAGSGGRSGSKTPGAYNAMLANNPFATGVHHGTHVYGPLPYGFYYMVPHESKANMIRLNPFSTNSMHGRSGFLIHGRGTIGSHGCIVPPVFDDLLKIYKGVADAAALKMKPVLKVVAIGSNLDSKQNWA